MVIVPRENQKDFEFLPQELKENIEVYYAETFDDIQSCLRSVLILLIFENFVNKSFISYLEMCQDINTPFFIMTFIYQSCSW